MLNKKKVFFYLRLCLGLFIIAFLLTKINIGKSITLWHSMNLSYLIFAILLYVIDRILVDYRLKSLLNCKGFELPLYRIIEISLMAFFIGKFFPSDFAPDVIKAYSLSKHILSTREAVSSVIVDRLAGFLSLLIMALVAISLFIVMNENPNVDILRIELIMVALLSITFFFIFGNKVLKRIFSSSRFLNINRWGRKIQEMYGSLYEYKEYKIVLVKALVISFFVQVIRSLTGYVIVSALNLEISIIYFFIFIPAITLILMIPTTIGGIGVAEGAYVYFFSQTGLSIDAAFTMCILFRAITMLTTLLPGGFIYVFKGISPKTGDLSEGLGLHGVHDG